METRERNASPTVERWRKYLDAAPRSFFALASFLERVTQGAVEVGRGGPPAREVIRFRHDPGLGFPSADVSDVTVLDEEPPRYQVVTTFLGLTGAVSPLPSYLVESVLFDAERGGVQRDFLDVFHHRVMSLLYRAKIRLDPAREHRSDGTDPWLRRLLGLAGIHEDSGIALEPKHLMRLIPILAKNSRGAAALKVATLSVLVDELPDAEVSVREFIGSWINLEDDQQTRLGVANNRLGTETMLGSRVFDRRGKFALQLGVLSREQAALFDEGEPLLDRVRAAVSLVLRDPLEYDLELQLEAGSTRALTLGASELGVARLAGFVGTEMITRRNVERKQGVNRSLI